MNEEYEEEFEQYEDEEWHHTDDELDESRLNELENEMLNYTYKIVKNEDDKIIFQALEDSSVHLKIGVKYTSYYKEAKKCQ